MSTLSPKAQKLRYAVKKCGGRSTLRKCRVCGQDIDIVDREPPGLEVCKCRPSGERDFIPRTWEQLSELATPKPSP